MSCVFLLLFLYLCSTVEGRLSYMQVYVNRIQLRHVPINERQHEPDTYSYYYVNGDMADFWCLMMQAPCTLQLNYEFHDDNIGGNGYITAKSITADGLLGLRTKFGAKHDGKSIVCKCSHDSVKYTITVVLQQASPNGLLNLKGLNTTILYDRLDASTSSDSKYNVNYAYKRDENIMLSCVTTDRNVKLQICKNNEDCIQDTKINIRPDVDGKMVRCAAQKNGAVIQTVNVYFTNFLSAFLYDEVPLNVNVENSLLELYEHKGDRRIYFDYIDGATPKISCGTSYDVMHTHNGAWLALNDTVSGRDATYVEKQVRLTSDHNRKTMNCDLNDANNHTLRHAEVLFRLKPRNSVPTPIGPIVSISEGASIQVEYGERKTLTCRVTSYSAPAITWTNSHRESLPAQSGPAKIVENEYISYLTIQYASKSDSYSCNATNNKNNQVKSIYVYVKEPFVAESTLPDKTWVRYGVRGALTCDIRSSQPYHIYWYHKEKEIDTNLPETSDKYEISSDGKVLGINVVNLDVKGKYKCVARLDEGNKSVTQNTEVWIRGLAPPKATGDDTKTAPVGSNIKINCSVTGTPQPTISWQFKAKDHRDFVPIPGYRNKLYILKIEEKDAGIYKCVAQNDLGTDEHTTILIVQVPPIVSGDMIKTTSEGSNTTIQCRASGTPKPTISWQFMSKHDTKFVSIAGSNNELNILRLKEKDAGTYKCVARNRLGISEHNITLNVQVPPKVTGDDTKSAPAGSNVTIECIVTGTPQPAVSWHFMAKDRTTFATMPVYGNMIHILNVEGQHAGLYKCSAWNDLNRDEHNTTLIVEEIENKNQKWIIAAASGVIIVIVSIVAAVCITKRSKLSAQTRPADDAPIPLYPSQWDRPDVVPVDQVLEDPTYSEAWTQKTETNTDTGSTSQKDGTSNGLIYADLDIASFNGHTPKRFIFDECPYAEVRPDYLSPDYVCLREN